MSRILLADDSPHAQRMGERILREEGFEVVTVTDGETALIRLEDVDPDLVMADVFLPHHSGYEICRFIKSSPRYRHARVILLAGLLEPVDEAAAARCGADAVLKKPFEASVVVALVRPLIEAAQTARETAEGQAAGEPEAEAVPEPEGPPGAEVPPEAEAEPAPGIQALPDPKAGREIPPEPGPAPSPEMHSAGQATGQEAGPTVPAEILAAGQGAGLPPIDPEREIPPEPGAAPSPEMHAAGLATGQEAGPTVMHAAGLAADQEASPTVPAEMLAAGHGAGLPPIDAERVRAAITVALDRALPAMIDEITERVLVALGQ